VNGDSEGSGRGPGLPAESRGTGKGPGLPAESTGTGGGPGLLAVRDLGLVDYRAARDIQRQVHADVLAGRCPHTLLLLEHPPVYTFGRRGGREHLLRAPAELEAMGACLVDSDRGGLVTFHGPGQLVGYPILRLGRLRVSLSQYVERLLDALRTTLADHGLSCDAVDMARPGLFVEGRKLASVGVRLSHGVTLHGFAVNLSPDLSWFAHIVPCGLAGVSATSVRAELGASPEPSAFGVRAALMLAARLGLSCSADAAATGRASES